MVINRVGFLGSGPHTPTQFFWEYPPPPPRAQSVDNISDFQESAVRLSFENEKVAKDNFVRLRQLGEKNLEIKANHNNPTAKKVSAEEMVGLEPTIYLSKKLG